ncbi:MAG TPA: HypC/HybG/HupF family hydrogenase formation chaperone [Bacteroidales bacterium]|nr:HypC/HybG/HupF family hydrogenase formation chaperone [Bacteroidales bacterium]HPE56336.1 HypC/HybG/HupF family hydrogenase formation chaperone [Bacteroidales bacterium]HRX95539.1 HypC/HybG/HupF family hydrogenase formation chaperone [Bacteroidales bacterium]
MCLAVPGKILKIDDSGELRMAAVDFGGVTRDICIEWLPEAGIGDYVLAHVGTALSMIDEESAKASLDAFDEIEKLMAEEDELEIL